MKIFKRLFCKHAYEFVDSYLINTGMQKMIIYKCSKCGKQKIKFV